MKEENKKQAHQKLRSALQSQDTKIILQALSDLREEGSVSDISILLDLLLNSNDTQILHAVKNILIDIKETHAVGTIISAIENNTYSSIKKELVSVCWESRLNFSDHLNLFVDLLIHEDFIVSFEAFTVIENMSGNITQEEKDRQTQKLKDAISAVDEERKRFLHEAIHMIQNISKEEI